MLDAAFHDLSLKQVSFYHQQNQILDRINLEIKMGQWIGIVGESGKGKSTILDLLVGVYPPKEGQVLINKKEISRYNESSLYQRISYVSQDSYLFSDTIKSNLKLVNPFVNDDEIHLALKAVGLTDVIAKLPQGIYSKIGEDGNTLSQGEKQRLIIAQALIKQPDIYILDEITSHLDTKTEASIRALFKSLRDEKGATIISVSHNHKFLEEADVVYELKNQQTLERVTLNLLNK